MVEQSPCGKTNSFASWIRHVRRFGPHSTPRGKTLERFPRCALVRTPITHVCSQVEKTWSFNTLLAARMRGERDSEHAGAAVGNAGPPSDKSAPHSSPFSRIQVHHSQMRLGGGRLDGVSGTLGFPLERWVSLVIFTMLDAAVGVKSDALTASPGREGKGIRPRLRREGFASIDVSYTTVKSTQYQINKALLNKLLHITRFAPMLQTNLRAEPCENLCAADASSSGAGGCVASITQEAWLALYDLAVEKGEHVRLGWKGEEPPSNTHHGRAAAPLAFKLNRATLFLYRFFQKASTSISRNSRA